MTKLAPVVGTFRKRVARDIVASLTVGAGAAYWFWYGYHIPTFNAYDKFFKATQEQIAQENEAYKKTLNL